MLTIEQLIGDLLLQNNCVIIPSFGGFVAQQISAKIDFKTGKAFPPSKSILFNKQLINNDGLLINEFAKKNSKSYDESSVEVGEKVTEWNQTIQAGGRVELDRIGILYNDAENNLCFEQDRFFNLLLASFGLEQVRFITEEDVQIIEKTIEFKERKVVPVLQTELTVEKTTIIEHPVLQPKKKKAWKYIAAACFLPIAFYSIWIPMKTDVLESGLISFQDFNPFHTTELVQYSQESTALSLKKKDEFSSLSDQIKELPNDVSVYSYKYSDELYMPVAVDKTSDEDIEIANNTHENAVSNVTEKSASNGNEVSVSNAIEMPASSVVEMNYIVGCFGDKNNAVNLVEKLKSEGLTARIIDFHNGLHRVTAGSAISLEELNRIKLSANSIGLKGWTLK